MQKAAQSSQLKSGNLGGGRVYAFRVNRVNADYVCLKLWLLGGIIRARNIAVAALPDLIAQIDAALADGCELVALGGAEFSAPEKVLSGIKKEFSYCCKEGASDANHVPVKPSSDSAESVKKCGAKPKASAPACKPSARQILNEELRMKNELRRTSYSGARTRATTGAVISNEDLRPLHSQAKSNAFMGNHKNTENTSECRGLQRQRRSNPNSSFFIHHSSLSNVANECCSCGDYGNAAIHSSFPRTKRGRTSVVVGVRKVAKFQPEIKKEKSK